jgi:hypothetical protein
MRSKRLKLTPAPLALQETRTEHGQESPCPHQPVQNFFGKFLVVADLAIAPKPHVGTEMNADSLLQILVKLRDPAELLQTKYIIVEMCVADEHVFFEIGQVSH